MQTCTEVQVEEVGPVRLPYAVDGNHVVQPNVELLQHWHPESAEDLHRLDIVGRQIDPSKGGEIDFPHADEDRWVVFIALVTH